MTSRKEELRVIILAPPRDGALTSAVLSRAAICSILCREVKQLVNELADGAGAVILAEEFMTEEGQAKIVGALRRQPPWSDLPTIMVAALESPDSVRDLRDFPNLSVLRRPLALETLVTAVESALRARQRQYEVRDLLADREEAARRKDAYLAMLAHELRNPLAPIQYATHILRAESAAVSSEASRAITLVERQVTHMSRLIDDLLDVSRINHGIIALHRRPVDVCDLLQQVGENWSPKVLETGKHFVIRLCEQATWVEGDQTRLQQVFDNLVSNAVKFTKVGDQIIIRTRRMGKQVAIEVMDTGEGIAQEQLPRVFEAFSQADRSLDRARGGLGLGLSLVRGIVELLGGSVSASSGGVGKGATFVITLPVIEAPFQESANAIGASATVPRLRVLVIEDNRASAELLSMMLRLSGHEVAVAHHGVDGLLAARERQPDAVLCDLGLPAMDGFEVARVLRGEGFSGRLIAITGYGEQEYCRLAIDAGFDAHLVKPVNHQDLAKELSKTQGQSRPSFQQ